jgi:hypothetical protein
MDVGKKSAFRLSVIKGCRQAWRRAVSVSAFHRKGEGREQRTTASAFMHVGLLGAGCCRESVPPQAHFPSVFLVGTFAEVPFLFRNEAFPKVLFGFAFPCTVPADFLHPSRGSGSGSLSHMMIITATPRATQWEWEESLLKVRKQHVLAGAPTVSPFWIG